MITLQYNNDYVIITLLCYNNKLCHHDQGIMLQKTNNVLNMLQVLSSFYSNNVIM
jgi:hypothetical protein